MRHFIAFQKKKALCLSSGTANNEHLAHGLNHELMAVGYVLSKEAFDVVASLEAEELSELYQDLVSGIRRVVGGDGYEPIYQNFPQSVLSMTYERFVLNALVHYWSSGRWRPEDAEHIHREFKLESVAYKPVGLLTQALFERIFEDLLYGDMSLSSFDKECVDWWVEQGGVVDYSRITFKEIASYVGQRLLSSDLDVLPFRRATTVLRLWSAWSGGDEGLKENTRYKSPRVRQRALLMATLECCGDLEDSFKTHREKWLRLLFYLHPLTGKNRERYPRLAEYTNRLRNHPETLQTYRSRVEVRIARKDPTVLDLLARRPGEFMRRLDHMVRLFGVKAVEHWLTLNLKFGQLITAYNHFSSRAEPQKDRGAVLASQAKSEFVTYKALDPLPKAWVKRITRLIMERLRRFQSDELDGPVYIAPGLYYTPLATNNRAGSLTLDSQTLGTVMRYEDGDTLRLYVHWEGRSDIDLSGFAISRDCEVVKIGWNGAHQSGSYIVYSGDNTGFAQKNAEYIDVITSKVPKDIEWIIVEARIYSGPSNFRNYNGKVHMGWMSRKHPEANKQWLPKTLQHAMVLANKAKVAYLMAYHPHSKNIVYLDMSMGESRVSNSADALQMRLFLERFVTLDRGEEERSWDKLNQGHVLELLAPSIVDEPHHANIVFDDKTTAEQVSRLLNAAAVIAVAEH